MSDSLESLEVEIAKLIVESLNLEDISYSEIDHKAPLFGGGLELDSIDALEIGAALSKRYNIKLKSQQDNAEEHFSSVESLALFVQSNITSELVPGS